MEKHEKQKCWETPRVSKQSSFSARLPKFLPRFSCSGDPYTLCGEHEAEFPEKNLKSSKSYKYRHTGGNLENWWGLENLWKAIQAMGTMGYQSNRKIHPFGNSQNLKENITQIKIKKIMNYGGAIWDGQRLETVLFLDPLFFLPSFSKKNFTFASSQKLSQ